MAKRIYVGNLSYSTTEDELRELFSKHGNVESINLIIDRDTGRSRGFAFVEMDQSGADAAISALNGQDLGGRSLRIDEARERGGGGGRGATATSLPLRGPARERSRATRSSLRPTAFAARAALAGCLHGVRGVLGFSSWGGGGAPGLR